MPLNKETKPLQKKKFLEYKEFLDHSKYEGLS